MELIQAAVSAVRTVVTFPIREPLVLIPVGALALILAVIFWLLPEIEGDE